MVKPPEMVCLTSLGSGGLEVLEPTVPKSLTLLHSFAVSYIPLLILQREAEIGTKRRQRKREKQGRRKTERLCMQIYDGWNVPREKWHGLHMVAKEREPYSTRIVHRHRQE